MGCTTNNQAKKSAPRANPKWKALKNKTSNRDVNTNEANVKLEFSNLEAVAGVLLYKISEYSEVESVPLMELFSTTIATKLKGYPKAF